MVLPGPSGPPALDERLLHTQARCMRSTGFLVDSLAKPCLAQPRFGARTERVCRCAGEQHAAKVDDADLVDSLRKGGVPFLTPPPKDLEDACAVSTGVAREIAEAAVAEACARVGDERSACMRDRRAVFLKLPSLAARDEGAIERAVHELDDACSVRMTVILSAIRAACAADRHPPDVCACAADRFVDAQMPADVLALKTDGWTVQSTRRLAEHARACAQDQASPK